MYESSDTPFLPFIEAQYANPRLAVYLKCLLYSQIRIDVDPHIMEDKHWLTQVKALIKDHHLNWQQYHLNKSLALNGYQLFISNGRSVRFMVLAASNTTEAELGAEETGLGTEEPRIITAAINDRTPANPVFRRSRSRSYDKMC
jgi:hypothetical protein